MNYLLLANESKIKIENGSSISNIMTSFESKSIMAAVWDLFTEENLKNIKIVTEDDEILAEYNDFILASETSVVQKDGTVYTCFTLREKTELELLKEEVEQLKASQEIQDGAIVELAEIIGGE